MPKWNMFGFRKTPSAEMLAGKGPTQTYPPPPSATASPTAIASVAAGTGIQITDDSITPINPAAAQANGFALASNRTANPSNTAPNAFGAGGTASKNSAVPAIPTGYQYGTRPSTPDPSIAAVANPPSYSIPSSYPAPSSGTPAGAGNYELPATATTPIANQQAPKPTTGSYAMPSTSSRGFALPNDVLDRVKQASSSAQQSAPFAPKTDIAKEISPAAQSMSLPGTTPASTVGTVGTKPSFSTASAALPPATNSLSMPPQDADTSKIPATGNYAPGSTGMSSGYPATSGYPSTGTNDSFYR